MKTNPYNPCRDAYLRLMAHIAPAMTRRRKYASLQTLLLTLLLTACTGEAPEPGFHAEPAPLNSITLTRGADAQWETIDNGSYVDLYVKDATGTEKQARYIYTDGQWTADNEILCANQATYPAYAYGKMNITYASGSKDKIPVAWHGNLATTVGTDGQCTAILPMNILTTRIHVTVIGAYGEAPGELPDFWIGSPLKTYEEFDIPADPYTGPISVKPSPDSTIPNWPLSYNNGYSGGNVAPQTIAAGSTFLTIFTDPDSPDPVYGTTKFTVIAPTDIEFRAGKEYHYTISLKGDGAKAEIAGSTTIADFAPGSENNIRLYQGIATEADLRQFSTDWNADPTAALAKWEDTPGSGIIRLLADIDMTGSEPFTPIGKIPNYFTAIFDGGGHTITGLRIEGGIFRYAALFERNSGGGAIYGLHLRAAELKGGNSIAGLVGENEGTITACSFGGTVIATGGMASSIAVYNRGTIVGCYSVATQISAPGYAAGIVGLNGRTITACHWLTYNGHPIKVAGDNNGTITDCHGIANPTDLYNNPQYTTLMNDALDALPDSRRPPYRWVQVPGGEPVLLPTP